MIIHKAKADRRDLFGGHRALRASPLLGGEADAARTHLSIEAGG